jgi:protease-4
MKQFFVTFFAVLAALLTLLLMVPLAALWLLAAPEIEVPKGLILVLDMNRSLREAPAADQLSRMVEEQPISVPEVVSALTKAAEDDRVVGLSLTLGAGNASTAQIQEIRDSIIRFKSKGKFVLAYAQQIAGLGLGAYYLAAASDQIWLQTTSELHATGMAVATPFVKESLGKIGVSPQFGKRREYKTAANTFLESDFTQHHRESLEDLVQSIFDHVTGDIAKDRGWAREHFVDLVNRGPHAAEDALEQGLIDRLGYRDEYQEALFREGGKEAEEITVGEYLERFGGAYDSGEKIALIYGVGTIVAGKSNDRSGTFSLGLTMGGDTIAQAFEDAAADPEVKAILFRVSSPGGSYLASDQIWRAAIIAREAGKPVVASLGALAASGGYFVAMAADEILTQPGTITGSIGVLGGKLVTAKLLEKLGVKLGEISVGENALLQSSQREYTPEQWQWINRSLDRVYRDFVAKVASARRLNEAQTDSAARGRIWSGSDALEVGLVDELGGFAAAIERAKALGGIEPGVPVKLTQFPRAKTISEQLATFLTGLDSLEKTGAVLGELAQAPYVAETLAPLGVGQEPYGLLSMPPLYELR